MLAETGVTAMDCKVPLVTAKLTDADLLPKTSDMFEFPTANAFAMPVESTVAVVGEEEVQLAAAIGCVVPSE
jgi:hypothetical protein